MKRKRSLSVEDTTTDQLAQSFNVNVQPLLDAMHSLLFLGVLDENGITIPRPSIVVVGNQSADKSFVVESLAEISLPVGPGIGTRVPLVVRFQSCSSEWITISYKNMIPRSIGRDEIESEVDAATNILAGTGTNVVTDEAILLIIRKPDAPDLIIIDLPGITEEPMFAGIYGQLDSAIVREYLRNPEDAVILNVIPVTTLDVSLCSEFVDQKSHGHWKRTLAVVTIGDDEDAIELPEMWKWHGEQRLGDLGYVCVRKQTHDDLGHEHSVELENNLFDCNNLFSEFHDMNVREDFVRGLLALAERVTETQARLLRNSLPTDVQELIDIALLATQKRLKGLPQGKSSDPRSLFLKFFDRSGTLLHDVMLNGDYDMFKDQDVMNYPATLTRMFGTFNSTLQGILAAILCRNKTGEILKLISDTESVSLSDGLSPTLIKTLVKKEIDNVENEAQDVLATSNKKCMKFVRHILKMERSYVFNVNDSHLDNVRNLREDLRLIQCQLSEKDCLSGLVRVGGFEEMGIDLAELSESKDIPGYHSAFDTKIRLAVYCRAAYNRMAEMISRELRHRLENALLKDLWNAILTANMGPDFSTLMKESASSIKKRLKLQRRVDSLKECKREFQRILEDDD